MKVGIIGSGPNAAQMALRLHDLGADVRVFADNPWLYRAKRWLEHHESSVLRDQLEELERQLSAQSISFIQAHVRRIHKARLTKSQSNPKGRSRLSDMFRIVTSENPRDGVLKQVESNPEVFAKLGQEVLSSLHEPMESFHDVDIVVACFDELFVQPGLTPSGAQALNEARVENQIITIDRLWQLNEDANKNLIVGGHDEVLNVLARQKTKIVHLQIDEEKTHDSVWLEACHFSHEQWKTDVASYQDKIHEWRNLEDYIKVKVPAPSEPVEQITSISDAALISIDQLVDQPGFFVTLEQGEEEQINTWAFDQIVNARNPVWNANCFNGLALAQSVPTMVVTPEEPGFYALGSNALTIWNASYDQAEIDTVMDDLSRWFRPAGQE